LFLPLVENYRFGNPIAALITIIIIAPFLWALALRRVAVKEVEILFKERKYGANNDDDLFSDGISFILYWFY
jgi:hypothetical protein